MSYTASIVVLFCINQTIFCCIYGISNVQSLGVFGDTVVQMSLTCGIRMNVPCARHKIPFVYGFHITTLCSHVVVTGNIFMCSFWMTFLRNDYVHILSEACYVNHLNLL